MYVFLCVCGMWQRQSEPERQRGREKIGRYLKKID